MAKVRISVVSYLNSLPFAYCLEHSDIINEIDLSYDIPSQCADKLLSNQADIGLIPIVETLRMPEYYIVLDLCIGAEQCVKTVILASEVPLQFVSRIYLDDHSRSSVVLARILAERYWHIHPEWIPIQGDIIRHPVNGTSAAVIIGDKAFGVQAPYIYDLASEWRNFSGLPSVFACWVANKPLNKDFILRLNNTMNPMLSNMESIAKFYHHLAPEGVDLFDYWTNNISYILDEQKRKGLELFLKYARDLY